MHEHLCARYRSCSPCQSSVDYGNTKIPSMHRRLGSATLSQLAFSRESDPNFPWEKSHWGNTVVKSKKKKKNSLDIVSLIPLSHGTPYPYYDFSMGHSCPCEDFCIGHCVRVKTFPRDIVSLLRLFLWDSVPLFRLH